MPRTNIAWLTTILAGLWCALGASGAATPRPLLVRHHFTGLGGIGARPDLSQVQAVLALPESRSLFDGVTRRLAVAAPGWFGIAGGGDTNLPALSPAVLRDLLWNESYLEVEGSSERVTGWALAVRLDAAAADKVGASLGKALAERAGVGVPAGGPAGWELNAQGGAVKARFIAANGWAVIGGGSGAVFEHVQQAVQNPGGLAGSGPNQVLRLEIDLAAIARLLAWSAQPPGPVDQWPAVDLSVEARSGRLRSAAQFRYARPLSLPADEWQIPTQLLREPLVGFSAVRGADTWVSRLGLLADLGIKEWPRQLFLWSIAGPPWQQYFAGAIASPSNLVTHIASDLPIKVMTNAYWKGQPFGLRVTNNSSRVEMHGLPYFQPFLESVRAEGSSAEWIHGGLFRLPPRNAPAPQELLSQVTGRTNLVIYDWETTGATLVVTNPPSAGMPPRSTNVIGRLMHFKHLYQFLRMSSVDRPTRLPIGRSGGIAVPGGDWIDVAAPLLGDSVTEVTRTGPAELTAVRQSRLGLTALELIHVLRWLENPAFPGWVEVPLETAGTNRPPVTPSKLR